MKIFKSFYFAFNGIRTAFLSERNLKIHLGCATFIILVAFIFKISLIEWALIVLCIGLVLTAELFNTAFEKLLDFIHPDTNPKIGLIKDISAGAVLVMAIAALLVGMVIFIPKLRLLL